MKRALAIAAVWLAACGGGGGDNTKPSPTLTGLTVSAQANSIPVGSTTTVSAVGIDQYGAAIATGTVSWSAAPSSIATVSAAGVVTAIAVGQVTITATSGSVSASAALSVTPAPIAAIAVSLANPALTVGNSTTASAVARDASGGQLEGRVFTWGSSNASVALVNAVTGGVTAVGPGAANITASSEGKIGSAAITVTQVPVATVAVVIGLNPIDEGATSTASAVTRDANGTILSGRVVTFSSSDQTVATINTTTGALTAVTAGTTTISAQSEGQTGTLVVTVRPVATRLFLANAPSATAPSRQVLPIQPSVQLTSRTGLPVSQAGIAVTASVQNATLTGTTTAVTNASGIATFFGIAIGGTAGEKTLTFSAPGLTNVIVNVSITAGAPAAITVVSGNGQTANASSVVPVAPTARVADLDGNSVSGVSVTFSVTGGGGTLTGATQVSDVAGTARVGSWTLGSNPGANSLSASSVSVAGSQALFTATATPRPATCGVTVFLALNVTTNGDLRASACRFIDPFLLNFNESPFPGSQPSGTYFYDRYLIDIPAGAIVRFEISTSPLYPRTIAYRANGAWLTGGYGSGYAVVNNTSGSTLQYQFVVIGSDAGETGAYTLLPRRIL